MKENPRAILFQNQSSNDHTYFSPATYSEFRNFYESIEPTRRTFHEVIISSNKRKLFFDIDFENPTQKIADNFEVYLEDFIELVYTSYLAHEGISLDEGESFDDATIFDMSKPTKCSAHVFFNNIICENAYAMAYLYKHMEKSIDVFMKNRFGSNCVDMKYANASTYTIRAPGSTKEGEQRFKSDKEYPNSLACCYDEELPIFMTYGEVKSYEKVYIGQEYKCQILEIARKKGLLEHLEFDTIRNGRIDLRRNSSGYCSICDKNHDNIGAGIIKSERGTYFKCYSDHADYIISLEKHEEISEEKKKISDKTWTEFSRQISKGGKPRVFDSLAPNERAIVEAISKTPQIYKPECKKNKYSDNNMRDFEDHDLLFIKANVAMGKTKKLMEIIKNEDSVVMISFRKTFTSEIHSKFSGFESYSKISGEISLTRYPKLIIQIDSLARLVPHENTVLVLDEIESIWDKMVSIEKNIHMVVATFKYMLMNNKRIICMDANLSKRTFDIFSKILPDKKPFLHWNEHKNMTDVTCEITPKKDQLVSALHRRLKEGKRVAFCSNTLKEANKMSEFCRRKFPKLRVQLYSSKTSSKLKEKHFSNVNKYWADLDVLIYTPTLTAGVSFEIQNYFDYLFGYFTNMSCNSSTSLQMLFRIRCCKNMILCLNQVNLELKPTNISDIEEYIIMKHKFVISNSLSFEYDRNLKPEFHKNSYYHILINTISYQHDDYNNYIKNFIVKLKQTGIQLKLLPISTNVDIFQYYKSINPDEKDNKRIMNSDDITQEQYQVLKSKLDKFEHVTEDELYSIDKYFLRKTYKLSDNFKFTEMFMHKYNTKSNIEKFRNLKDLIKMNPNYGENFTSALSRSDKNSKLLYVHRFMNLVGYKIGEKKVIDLELAKDLKPWGKIIFGKEDILDNVKKYCGIYTNKNGELCSSLLFDYDGKSKVKPSLFDLLSQEN